jgi:hypothetical protein
LGPTQKWFVRCVQFQGGAALRGGGHYKHYASISQYNAARRADLSRQGVAQLASEDCRVKGARSGRRMLSVLGGMKWKTVDIGYASRR